MHFQCSEMVSCYHACIYLCSMGPKSSPCGCSARTGVILYLTYVQFQFRCLQKFLDLYSSKLKTPFFCPFQFLFCILNFLSLFVGLQFLIILFYIPVRVLSLSHTSTSLTFSLPHPQPLLRESGTSCRESTNSVISRVTGPRPSSCIQGEQGIFPQ